ncbi:MULTISPECIES: helix-turn-helix domain-containing protein [unclassified Bradyrhizobium]|uniref:helix-turn-helix domain-containing protein n=1 Tax=unclassified Bradyrhizobium TaxID=2631580 RepID=UPI001BAE0234|nr:MULTISPECIES: helix-turn-helix domain-containing protein [unclassified Bradyrhizobium]MBR1227840.1 helix-turn-helix domain-containing protein [Bradyrhizobium sp. AUGA SZCCT0176]MBR1232665.1 helix-turn-helix domain-containing protein [Bradyrhizobium sp. AUGA SZCCT0182]MBR1281112.1 helix-turn-helix domain-containing protein [Bradyrhizobium sp. AUGA SZCCT0177]MBR1300566.1 helix-turn-helix domain-containing protein [Bradyrhizobium sp. AUGA SZCCT0042]
MFVRITTDPTPRPTSLGELGITSDSNPKVSLNEFTYKKGTEIYGETEPADYVYQVKTGAVRSYKLLSDGRRQIGAFHLVGDIFGLENGNEHRFTAEAIVSTTVRLIKRRSLEMVAESDAMVSRNLLSMTTDNLQHAENHMLLLGRKTSLERVAAFLIEMDRRLTAAGVMPLPMSRRDIADYLGLTLETVSRALSRLHEHGIIGFIGSNQRQIVLLNRRQLATLDLQN